MAGQDSRVLGGRLSRLRARAWVVAALAAVLAGGAVTAAPVAGAAVAPAASTPTATPSRAMWVWDVADPEAVVALALERGIGTLFVAVPPDLPTSAALPAVRALAQSAAAAGLRVDALGGDPGWVDDPTWVVNRWLTPALSTGLFTGVHVDAEPWTTSAWTKRRSQTVTRYLTLLDRLRAAAGSRPLEADIPFWFHEIPAGRRSTLDRETMLRVSGVTIMAYRNVAGGPDGTLDVAGEQLASAAALGRPARVGQETRYVGSAPSETKQTYFGQTLTRMHDQLALVDDGARAYASYAGIAVHDSTGYAAMAP